MILQRNEQRKNRERFELICRLELIEVREIGLCMYLSSKFYQSANGVPYRKFYKTLT